MSRTKGKKMAVAAVPRARTSQLTQVAEGAGFARTFRGMDAWLSARTEWIVWLVALAALYLRVSRASQFYFNGDEALIIFAPQQHGVSNVYRAMLAHPHGPLPNFLLYFLSWFGDSELYFRMPFVLAGSLLVYVAYRWVADVFGKGAGLIAACIVGFSPAMVILSAQIRFYMLQILFMACALYCLERAFRDRSIQWMRMFGASVLLALLAEYNSALWVMGLGAYALLRVVSRELPRRLVLEWAGTQVAAVLVLLVVYVAHLRHLEGTGGERLAQDVWLRPSYYHPGADDPLGFFLQATKRLFGYVFSNDQVGMWMIAVFAIGIALVVWGKGGMPRTPRLAVLSLLFPILVTAGAAFMSLYPYGGSRHDAFLALFLAAGVAPAISFAARGRILALTAAAVFLVYAWRSAAEQHILDDVPAVSKMEQMRNALDYLGSRSPQPRVLVVDQLGSATLNYYVCHSQIADWRRLPDKMHTYRCADYRILMVNGWGVPVDAFPPEALRTARRALPDLFPDPAWAFSVSADRSTDRTIALGGAALFGKIELDRFLPQSPTR